MTIDVVQKIRILCEKEDRIHLNAIPELSGDSVNNHRRRTLKLNDMCPLLHGHHSDVYLSELFLC